MQVDQRARYRAGLALIGALGMAASGAHAYQAGDWIMRLGAAAVDPRDSSNAIDIAASVLPGTGVGLDTATAVGLSATYMLSPAWGIELLAATPFRHDVAGKGLGIGRLGSISQLPPTLTLQYYFLPAGSRIQPYAGVGLNYTLFFQESASSAARAALGASRLALDDSVGLAAQLGVDVQLGDRWLANAAVWRMDIDTTATLETALGRAKVDLDIDPWVYTVGVGYRF